MVNKTFIILLICLCLFGVTIWYYLNQDIDIVPSIAAVIEPVTNIIQNLHETANIERKIEELKTERDPPEIQRLNEQLAEFESDTTKWDILIAIGDIYRKGAYPRFLPNEDLAIRIYKMGAMCPNGQIAGIAQSKYVETMNDPIKSYDRAGVALPETVGIKICTLAETVIQTTPWHLFEKPRMHKAEPVAIPAPIGFNDDFEELIQRITGNNNTIPEYRIDSQNVHDHGVTKITNYNIDNLKKNVDIRTLNNKENEIEHVRNAILSHNELDAKTKEEALHVIDKLNDFKHSSFDVTERDALVMVWDNINKADSELKSNLTETLAKQLSSSIENGSIVCSSGKITRIMSTLDGVSNESTKPMWAIKEELANTASKIRDDMTKQYGDTPEAGKYMREQFSKDVKDLYIGKLGMNEKIINPLISEYEMGF
jgi:hypothetical protein